MNSRISNLDRRRADFCLFRDLFGNISWDVALEDKGHQKNQLIFKDNLLRAQEWLGLMFCK